MRIPKAQLEALLNNTTRDQQVELINDLIEAAHAAEDGLQGRFPWYIHGRATQKEARETAHDIVARALTTINQAIQDSKQPQAIKPKKGKKLTGSDAYEVRNAGCMMRMIDEEGSLYIMNAKGDGTITMQQLGDKHVSHWSLVKLHEGE